MHSWTKKTLIALFGFSLLAGTLGACSRGHHAQLSSEEVAQLRDRVADKLELDSPQRQKLSVLTEQLLSLRNDLKADAGEPRNEVASLFASNKFDRSKAQALLDEKTAAMQKDGPDVIIALADFYDSLDAAQQQKIRERLEKRKGWFQH